MHLYLNTYSYRWHEPFKKHLCSILLSNELPSFPVSDGRLVTLTAQFYLKSHPRNLFILILPPPLQWLTGLFSPSSCYCHQCHWPWTTLLLRWMVPLTPNQLFLPSGVCFSNPLLPSPISWMQLRSECPLAKSLASSPDFLLSWSRPLTPDLTVFHLPCALVVWMYTIAFSQFAAFPMFILLQPKIAMIINC